MNIFKRFFMAFMGALKYLKGKEGGLPLDFIKVLRVKPGDVVVLRSTKVMTAGQFVSVEKDVKEILGGRNNVLVLDSKWSMEVLKLEDPPVEPSPPAEL